MSTEILQAEVQSRIDALVYPVDLKVLLQSAVDTVGLGLDLTNIISVLTAATDTITSATSEQDLTVLNTTSLALGVTTKSDSSDDSSVNSGHSMIMPKTLVERSNLYIKSGSDRYDSASSSFYTVLEEDNSELGYEVATLSNTLGTEEQVVVDTGSGSQGVLTQVLTPVVGTEGVTTIKVTADGVEYLFSSDKHINYGRLIIGDFLPWVAATDSTTSVGYGSYTNEGYTTAFDFSMTMLSPLDSLTKGLPFGIKFTDRLIVSVQHSVRFYGGGSSNKAVACWLNHIPEGV